MFAFSKALSVFALVLAASFATPAFAEADDQSEAYGSPKGTVKASTARMSQSWHGYDAMASGYRPTSKSKTSVNDVYVNGQYVGSDPDPRVRYSIRMDAIGAGM